MPRFRLRYQSTDLEMVSGEFVVGRSSSCHLALDDALVSRRHAVFHVTAHGVEVEDLGSRNGVQVNSVTIPARTRVKHLDRVVIGAQELLLIQIDDAEVAPGRTDRPTLAGMTLDLPILKADEIPDEPTMHRTGSVIGRLADKALALGRYDEAERMLSRRLDQLLTETRAGQRLTDETLLACSGYAIRLAEGTGKARWIDWLFEIHDAAGRVVDADSVERLHHLVRRVRYPGGPPFRRYLTNLRSRIDSLSPSQRFLLQRLEGIERMVGA